MLKKLTKFLSSPCPYLRNYQNVTHFESIIFGPSIKSNGFNAPLFLFVIEYAIQHLLIIRGVQTIIVNCFILAFAFSGDPCPPGPQLNLVSNG